MDLRLQPKPEIEIKPADRGIVSKKEYFVKKVLEEINQYFYPALFVRQWRPKAQLLYPTVSAEADIQYECDFNRDIQNCFVEDYAEEEYLRTPPPCFVVIGKFGANVSKLGQSIAEEYGSVLIQVDDVVTQVLQIQSETSKFLDRILRLGVSLTLNFILTLLSYVAHTAEAKHRGYVLCGLPSLPHLHDMSVEQQFNYLFSWDNKPTVFIHILYEDEDLIVARSKQRYEMEDAGRGKRLLLRDTGMDFEDEEDVSDTEVDASPEPDIDISPSRPWIRLPRDEESSVWSELELFDCNIKPLIDLIAARIDPQYFITVDSRVKNEFEVVRARLALLNIWKSPLPIRLIPVEKTEETSEYLGEGEEEEEEEEEESYTKNLEDEEIRRAAMESPPVAFLKFFNKKTLSPKYRWELSHYNYVCPVTLRKGEVVEGKSEFAVIFMKYIYFLRDEECVKKFLANPRPYVLPVRPKPPVRFIIAGYPFSGKTLLAASLASKFSIPLINLNMILRNDRKRKKEIYMDFCRQKAEHKEMIRLTAQAWQDWRIEEERRVALIEEWIQYIQSLLMQRIEQFYSLKPDTQSISTKETQIQLYSPINSEDSEGNPIEPEGSDISEHQGGSPLEVRGVTIRASPNSTREYTLGDTQSSPSAKIIQAMKNEDYDFNKKGMEVDANLFFSSLWNTFSGTTRGYSSPVKLTMSSEDEMGEGGSYGGETEDGITVDWCSLLPPQSLSSFLLKKTPYTKKERTRSFRILLSAASKAYWAPSHLKTEFTKWRLPCFMDIPLCEIYLNNPLLLLRYCPEWLKERPLIPEPVDMHHPAIEEAGRLAYKRADVINIQQTKEEVGILLRDAIEKAEKEGMRLTGDVMTPGGWVVDNMVLDPEVWAFLAKEKVYADHVYFLVDTEPECRRIVNKWFELHQEVTLSKPSSILGEHEMTEEDWEEEDSQESDKVQREWNLENESEENDLDEPELKKETLKFDIVNLLVRSSEVLNQGTQELDEIFEVLLEGTDDSKYYTPTSSVDPFSHHVLQHTIDTWCELKEGSLNEEPSSAAQSYSESNFAFYSSRQVLRSAHNLYLGAELQTFTSKIINIFTKPPETGEKRLPLTESEEGKLAFFVSLLLLPGRLEKIKKMLNAMNKGETLTEIVVTGRETEELFEEIVNKLMEPFIKKPRELEPFEVNEIRNELELEAARTSKKYQDEEEVYEEEEEDYTKTTIKEDDADREDVRIYGESGPFCIVNLERNILLKGKPEYVLRYYGKLYFFWNQEAKDKFIADPEKYAPYYSVIRSLPPLRVFVMGPVGVGKTMLSAAIANQTGCRYKNFLELLNHKLVPHLFPSYFQRVTALTNKLLITEGHNKEALELKEKFMNAPYKKRKYWLENTPYISNEESEQKELYKSLHSLDLPPVYKTFPEPTYGHIGVDKTEKIRENELQESPSKTDNQLATPFLNMKSIEENIKEYLKNTAELHQYCVTKALGLLWDKKPYTTQGFVLDDFPVRSTDVKHIIENNWLPDLILKLNLPEEEVIDRNINFKMEEWDLKLNQEIVEERLLEETLNSIQNTYRVIRGMELRSKKRALAYQKLGITDPHEYASRRKSPKIVSNFTGDSGISPPGIRRKSSKVSGDTNGDSVGDNTTDVISRKKPSRTRTSWGSAYGSSPANQVIELPPAVENEIEEEVEEILNEEFKPLVFNPEFETYDAGKERIIEDIIVNYRRDLAEMGKIKEQMLAYDIPWMEIDTMEDSEKNQHDVFRQLDPLKKRTGQRGEFAFSLKMDMAEKLLQQGFYFLSKFGRWCPVQAYRMKNPIHMYRPLHSKGKVFPVAYRNFIYFVGGENEKKKFIEDPVKYTFNEPHHPNIPLRIAVIGPPKSGKSMLCQRLGLTFDLKVITMGSAIRFVLEKMPGSLLEKSVNFHLRRGCFLPLSLKIEAVLASLNDPRCVTQGFILDGIPFDAAMTQSLAEKGKLPFVILSLIGDAHRGKVNREKLDLNTFRLPYKQRVNLDARYDEWNKTYTRFAQWNQDTYNNLYEMSAKSNVADIFYWAYDVIKKSFFAILYYVEYCISDKALPLEYLCVSQHEYELRKSSFDNNCPVCWGELKRLSCCPDPPPRSGLVQFLNYFYWICPNHMEMFLERPKRYLPPYVPECPSPLPKIVNRSVYEAVSPQWAIHGQGRCPVTRVDFPSVLDWEGSWDFAVSYRDKIYLCKNKEMLERFLSQPWRYYAADTEFEVQRTVKSKAVEQLAPPTITSLPPIGFLEQTVANLIQDALQLVGALRPVYPDLTPTCTGCVFVGLYLKVHNKNNKLPSLAKEMLNFMFTCCNAYRFRVPLFKKDKPSESKKYYEPEGSETSVSSQRGSQPNLNEEESERPSVDSMWLDFETQADKKMWSAKWQTGKFTEMILTRDNDLLEAPDTPEMHVILKYQTYSRRSCPLPPVTCCLTYLYARRSNVKIAGNFNYQTLYQPLPVFVSPYAQLQFNPHKVFAHTLHKKSFSADVRSETNLWEGKRAISETNMDAADITKLNLFNSEEEKMKYMLDRFIPRFQLLDTIDSLKIPKVPKVVEKEPIVFNPQRDYSYTLLLAEFFKMTHVLQSFEWNESQHHLEYSSVFEKNLGLCNVRSKFLLRPKVTRSVRSERSIDSYQRAFDAASVFCVRDEIDKSEESQTAPSSKASLTNYIQLIILEKLDEMFARVSESNLTYDSYEFNILTGESEEGFKQTIIIREVLPYPPMPWDIISRPYYAYRAVQSVFEVPPLDNIAHERHVSLLDGIMDPNDRFRFVRYPTWIQNRPEINRIVAQAKQTKRRASSVEESLYEPFLHFDFFGLKWTSFLPYPYSWAYNVELRDNFCGLRNENLTTMEESDMT